MTEEKSHRDKGRRGNIKEKRKGIKEKYEVEDEYDEDAPKRRKNKDNKKTRMRDAKNEEGEKHKKKTKIKNVKEGNDGESEDVNWGHSKKKEKAKKKNGKQELVEER